jgi:D-alanyl-D-alanine carboxypeptidase/D-alanyl-D-alanine-endopeptidase (penicillin-binding protein 4)
MTYSRPLSVFITATLIASAANPPTLKSRIDAVVADSPVVANAFAGIRVVRLKDGHVLYAHDDDHLFAPASNTKLFTTALALTTLGPEYRFTTTVVSDHDDLVFIGGGDPSLSPRHYPYDKSRSGQQAEPFETIPAIEELADQIVARGLKSIDGNVVGDDRRYVWEPYPDGWSVDDANWEYGAPVSALVVNDNNFTLWIRPGENPGDLARILTSPSFIPLSINNRLYTTASGDRKISVDRRIGSHELDLSGRIPASDRGTTELLAVDDPAVFAAAMLRDALIRRGVSIRGGAVARHRFAEEVMDPKRAAGVELARRESPPLVELIQVVDKVSQNLHAEVMLREVGAMKRNMGTREAGQEEMKMFLAQAAIAESEYHLVDGSGLSRLTLVTPAAITKLLVHMYRSRYRKQWISLLPIAGVDGTLSNRFDGHPEASAIQAKTGSLTHVRAMSGYAESKEYGPVAFSIVVNNTIATAHDMSAFLDTIGLKLIE